MSTRKNYRVSSKNCVLNYYDTESSAIEYLSRLKKHSPFIATECIVERRDHDDPSQWNQTKTDCEFLFCGAVFTIE